MSAAEVAEATKDHSMWLAARHAFRQQQIQHYQKDMEQYQRTKPLKEQTYERDITIVPSRGGEDLYIDF
jgi:hypothetical protein